MSSGPSPAPDLAVPPALLTRAVGGVGTSIVGGALVGAASWLSDELGYPAGLLLPANLIGVWLGLAFALGTTARTIPTGALRGLIGLLTAVVVYYLLIAFLGVGVRAIGASHAATVWGVVALAAGPLFGVAGAVWRHAAGWPRAIAVGLLAAALIGEGLVFGASRLANVTNLPDDLGALVLLGEVVLGIAVPWLLLRRPDRLAGYAATLALGTAAALAIGPVTTLVRGIADRF